MLRTSLDGRSRKNPEPPSKATETPKAQSASKIYSANLKEASPPKTNPWRRIKAPSPQLQEASESLDQHDWPRAEAAAPKQDSVASAAPKAVHNTGTSPAARAARQRSASASQGSSREVFQAAAARAGESLWNLPFGADIWLYAEDKVLQVHRSVVAPKSGWIRDKLLPPHSNGAPVGVYFPGAAKIIGHSLKFMYTDRIEPCEPMRESPHDITHVACCSLFYLVAVDLRAHTMAVHILDTLALTSEKWKTLFVAHFSRQPMSRQEGMEFTLYLKDALEAAYAYPSADIVAPLKLALAGFLDIVLPLIIQYPTVINLLSTAVWQRYSSLITADMIEHRHRERSGQVPCWSLPHGQTLQALLEQAPTRSCDFVTWSSRGQMPEASARALYESANTFGGDD
ncbi:hypothetical protein HRG_002721 [Hirsutella rhossiliensis]|uniref:BTB domain-containing protein n=1 Tax=Hirsutella rhossiliensis TaxID=111463 RepID=A0A9P8N672_9HYPO|nr:uncharacterized protein HRG_02721 [Hirsutella rhossiliensis]KAH0967312.1 hypothetical protein HRG_02721 [Hirsutella rhossiliensis]